MSNDNPNLHSKDTGGHVCQICVACTLARRLVSVPVSGFRV